MEEVPHLRCTAAGMIILFRATAASVQLTALVCTSYAFITLPHLHQLSSSTSKRIIQRDPSSLLTSPNPYCHRTQLQHSLSHKTLTESDVIERLELTGQFERWKFLQQLLENELPHSDIEDVLLLSLSAYLEHGPSPSSYNNKDENGGNASPVLSDEQRRCMSNLITEIATCSDGIGDSRFLHFLVLPRVDYESLTIDNDDDDDKMDDDQKQQQQMMDEAAISILHQIEQLLPDPTEDEESYKSAWDVVIDLYGRESVRVNEEKLQREKESNGREGGGKLFNTCLENLQWRTLCAVGRVLIHYDFLTKGVLKEGTFR